MKSGTAADEPPTVAGGFQDPARVRRFSAFAPVTPPSVQPVREMVQVVPGVAVGQHPSGRRHQVPRAAWSAFVGELRRLLVGPWERLRSRGVLAVALAGSSTALVLFFWAVQQTVWGTRAAWLLGGVRADIPLWLALLRTPVSLFVPAPDLPVWGALAQVFVVFALAELIIGRWRTVAVAMVVTLAGTLGARAMIAAGTGHALGLPGHDAHVLDTGPSAAVVGLLVCLAWVRRAPVLFVVTVAAMVVEVTLKPNLAGREHLIGIAVAFVCAFFLRRGGAGSGGAEVGHAGESGASGPCLSRVR